MLNKYRKNYIKHNKNYLHTPVYTLFINYNWNLLLDHYGLFRYFKLMFLHTRCFNSFNFRTINFTRYFKNTLYKNVSSQQLMTVFITSLPFIQNHLHFSSCESMALNMAYFFTNMSTQVATSGQASSYLRCWQSPSNWQLFSNYYS